MGDIADGLIDGEFDFHTGEYLGKGVGYPRTGNKSLPWESGGLRYTRAKSIRKELAILIKEKHKSCTTDKEKNRAVNEARAFINEKYGYDWRNKPDT